MRGIYKIKTQNGEQTRVRARVARPSAKKKKKKSEIWSRKRVRQRRLENTLVTLKKAKKRECEHKGHGARTCTIT